ncbi:HigA family addiction module antidote protein [Sphingobium sp. 3R8]|uniref:Transcriptional regulator n=2 Tax=Sphingomonas bisphenolicum TaxID=296544 RepID=A0ABM7FTY6_9SPHN|nr:HigA family addiction module antitoxin [Sphingobium sp. 3R8]MBZ9646371.1 HigA family addiction module antidote protein [Sphingobium sp. 3R8]BBF68562.1 transcriptional regulator [Sphingomonas bisphenolicum]
MSGSRTITEDDDRLDNIHPGSILREDFMIGSDVPIDEVIKGAGITHDRLEAILAEIAPIDANIDLRLARYFGVSEGFFLGLQIDYDLEEERRAHGDDLDRITRRAA